MTVHQTNVFLFVLFVCLFVFICFALGYVTSQRDSPYSAHPSCARSEYGL